MWSVALVGMALLVFCLFGWLGERYLFRGSSDVLSRQVAEDTCENHGVLLCEKCFSPDAWGIQ